MSNDARAIDILAQHYGGFLNEESAVRAAERAILMLANLGYVITKKSEIVCRGSWVLGTACGGCSVCIATARGTIDALRKEKYETGDKLASVMGLIPPLFENSDYKDEVKVRMFDTVRKHLYGDIERQGGG